MRFAAEHGIHAAFFGVDSTRADLEFFRQRLRDRRRGGRAARSSSSTRSGSHRPRPSTDLVGRTIQWLDGTPVHFHGHNDFGLATASAVAAVRAGATWVHGTINGMGERAGNANLGEVALDAARALRRRVEPAARPHPCRSRRACASCRATSSSRGSRSPARRCTAARAARSRRSSTTRRRSSRTPPSSSATERSIVLGKKSGLDSIRIKADELGLDVPEERRAEVLAAVKQLGTREARARHRRRVQERSLAERTRALRRDRRRQRASTASRARRCSRKAGWHVCVLERNDWFGGAIKTAEITAAGVRARRLQRLASALGRRRRARAARRRPRARTGSST